MRGAWNWSCGRSWSAWHECWESTKPGSSVRAAIVTNCWGISPAFCPVLACTGRQTTLLTFWSKMSVSSCQTYATCFISFLFSLLPLQLFSLTPLPSEFSWRHICSQMTVHKVRGPVLTFWENFVFFLQIKFLHSKEVPYPCVPFHTSASIVIAVLEYSSVFLILLGCLKFSIKIIYLLFPAKVILLSAGLMYLTLTNLHKYCISV